MCRLKKGAKEESMSLPLNYKPSDNETYMNSEQIEYFREKLLKWREELQKETVETLHHMQEESLNEPDINDRATTETDRSLELRTRDRERKLILKINLALERIENGTYGYCEETGVPIGVARLDARPIATLCLEAQEHHERLEKTHREE
ncbi:MAG: RNA polymerase-binding protein DksA [Alphaproteobacteria bacterium]|nr:RNA polymerase-binding protein DksA [Alphaproteobacteria bacterium]